MSLGNALEDGLPRHFPRVSGDEPRVGITVCSTEAFSPRERG